MTSREATSSRTTTPTARRTVALVGLGEVGRIYGAALDAAGHDVRGYDAFTTAPADGIKVAGSLAEAVAEADIVLVLTAAVASHTVAEAAVPHLKQHATYIDCTSSSPHVKQGLSSILATRSDVAVVDVAILGPVIALGTRTPLMAAGTAAGVVEELMGPLGAPVAVVDGNPGDAMAHKLLRSVFMKGLAAAITEAVAAGRAVGAEDWIRTQIARELAGDGQGTIDRFLRGSVLHARRRAEEMEAAAAYLADLGVAESIASATAQHLRRLEQSPPAAEPLTDDGPPA